MTCGLNASRGELLFPPGPQVITRNGRRRYYKPPRQKVKQKKKAGPFQGGASPSRMPGVSHLGSNSRGGVGVTGFEPATSWSRTNRSSSEPGDNCNSFPPKRKYHLFRSPRRCSVFPM